MHDFLCKNPKEMHYEVLSDNAKLTKEREDEKGMCKIIDDIVQRERKEAEKQVSIETARRMIDDGETNAEKIARYTSLTVAEVEALMAKPSA